MRWISLLVLLLSIASNALPSNAQQPIHLFCDHFHGSLSGSSRLIGDVRLVQGSLEIIADEMVIDWFEGSVKMVKTIGQPAKFQMRSSSDGTLVSGKATQLLYYRVEETLELQGNVLLTQNDNQTRAERIRFDLKKGEVIASSSSDDQVEIILNIKPPPLESQPSSE